MTNRLHASGSLTEESSGRVDPPADTCYPVRDTAGLDGPDRRHGHDQCPGGSHGAKRLPGSEQSLQGGVIAVGSLVPPPSVNMHDAVEMLIVSSVRILDDVPVSGRLVRMDRGLPVEPEAVDSLLQEGLAAFASRLAVSRKSMNRPSRSAARHGYRHCPPIRDTGLVHMPSQPSPAWVITGAPGNLGTELPNPAKDSSPIHRDPALCSQIADIPLREGRPAVPAPGQQDHLTRKPVPFERSRRMASLPRVSGSASSPGNRRRDNSGDVISTTHPSAGRRENASVRTQKSCRRRLSSPNLRTRACIPTKACTMHIRQHRTHFPPCRTAWSATASSACSKASRRRCSD